MKGSEGAASSPAGLAMKNTAQTPFVTTALSASPFLVLFSQLVPMRAPSSCAPLLSTTRVNASPTLTPKSSSAASM
ncbi:unnamed protein product [Lampetra planeri]